MHKGLLVTEFGFEDVEYDDYEDIQELLDCDCFAVCPWLFGDSPACYIDDEGKFDGNYPNRALYHDGELVDIIFGDMLFAGIDMETGESRDITEDEKRRVRERFSDGESGPGSGIAAIMGIRTGIDWNGLQE